MGSVPRNGKGMQKMRFLFALGAGISGFRVQIGERLLKKLSIYRIHSHLTMMLLVIHERVRLQPRNNAGHGSCSRF